MLLGAHQSIAGGLPLALGRGQADACEAIQIFTRSARCWAAPPLPARSASAFRAERKRSGLPVVAHGSYLVNLASANPANRPKSLACFLDEVRRVEALGCQALILHPGSNPDVAEGLRLVAEALSEVIRQTPRFRSRILLEVTAGQGACLGHRFEHLAEILDQVGSRRLGVCLDSCHLFAAGYDIASADGYRKVMGEFDRIIGLDQVQAFHLNDCKKPLGCRVDRHEDVGRGQIGLGAFERLVNDPHFERTVAVLETPNPDNYRTTLQTLRGLRVGGTG